MVSRSTRLEYASHSRTVATSRDDAAARPGPTGGGLEPALGRGSDREVDPVPRARTARVGPVVDGDEVGPRGRGERAQHLARRAVHEDASQLDAIDVEQTRPHLAAQAGARDRGADDAELRGNIDAKHVDVAGRGQDVVRGAIGRERRRGAGRRSGVAVLRGGRRRDERYGNGEHRDAGDVEPGPHDEPPSAGCRGGSTPSHAPGTGAMRNRARSSRKTMQDDRAGLDAVARFVDLSAPITATAPELPTRCAPTSSSPLTPGSADDRGDARRAAALLRATAFQVSCFPVRERGAGARGWHPRGLSYRPTGHAASPRRRNLRARIAVSSVVSSPSTRTATGRPRPAPVVAILDG